MGAVSNSVADYVHSLGLDAYVVGGAVRDELLGIPVRELDFVVPGVGHAELRAALEPHGRVEDLIVADQRVGARLLPRDKDCPCARSRRGSSSRLRAWSGRPGRAATTSRSSPTRAISLEQDMERRDFTINAIARRLATGEVLDPLGGRDDLERRVLRTTSATSFRDDPLRIVRGLRFVSQLGFDPDEDTLRQMREWAPQLEPRVGRADRRRARRGRPRRALEAPARRASGEGAPARPRHGRAPLRCSPSSSRRSATSSRAPAST